MRPTPLLSQLSLNPLIISTSAHPHDPSIFRIADSTLLLNIHDYGPHLPLGETYRTFQTAVDDVIRNIWPDPTWARIPMVPRPGGYVYGTERVRLMVLPQPEMTWGMWADVLGGLRRFVEQWEFVAFEYGVWDMAEGFRGNGNLWKIA